jgi:hypothetical protein
MIILVKVEVSVYAERLLEIIDIRDNSVLLIRYRFHTHLSPLQELRSSRITDTVHHARSDGR